MSEGLRAPPKLDLVLTPHRSLTPTGFWVVMAILIALNFLAGTMFLVLGAWPVVGFMGLDVLLVYWAFRVSFSRARTEERVRLDDDALTVERRDANGGHKTYTFRPPHWLRVSLQELPGREAQLVLSSHGRHVTLGSFLPPEERTEVADAIRNALARLRAPQPSPSTSFMP
jgi:uncharacterized membrane protein